MHSPYLSKASRPFFLLFLLTIFFLSFLSYGTTTAAADDYKSTTIIGVVIDEASRVGKEHKTAIKIAVKKFNNSSNHKLKIHFRNITADDPLKTATAGEKVYSSFTKTVVVVWLFVVLVLSSSYTASLSSMLTVQRLEPKVKDIEWLRKTNSPVGCDGDSFVKDFVRNVLKLDNILNISNETDYPSEFDKGNISASFLELPYQKVFLQDYCNKYTAVGPTYRFGGLGFVFRKGSPIARDVSEAILNISENGVLKGLEKKWFPTSTNCSASSDSLTIESFWVIYLISGVTSTACLLIFIAKLLVFGEKKDLNEINQETDDIPAQQGFWGEAIEMVRYVKYISNNRISPARAILFALLFFLL